VEQTKFYNQDLGVVYQVLLTLSTQILGYALAGATRQYLVRPSGMIWPATLVSTAMFRALHKNENKPANGWRISPSKFFLVVFCGSVAFYFLPGLLMPALSNFSVITWFAPDNVVVANLVSTWLRGRTWVMLTATVWYVLWTWTVPCDFRLGTNRIHWISISHTVLGSIKHYRRASRSHVDRGSNNVYVAPRLIEDASLTIIQITPMSCIHLTCRSCHLQSSITRASRTTSAKS
jgi:hypothetical protein